MDGIFGKRFDLDGDGHMSVPEHMADFSVFGHFMDELDAEGAEEAKTSRHDNDDLGIYDTSDTDITNDPSDAAEIDFLLDDRKYYATLFADVVNIDELDDDDEFDEGYREDDDDLDF